MNEISQVFDTITSLFKLVFITIIVMKLLLIFEIKFKQFKFVQLYFCETCQL